MPPVDLLLTVASRDGTSIAFERTGRGPPLVLVHGTAGDHTRWELFDVRSALAEHCTVYAMDRRGRGGSGDAPEYELEREFEDVAAVVDSVAEPVVLLGHSYGALCALEAALLSDNVARLILYEPPTPWEIVGPHLYTEETRHRLEALLDAGDLEGVLTVFLRDVVELPEDQLDELWAAPSWQRRVEAAHTIPREERASAGYEFAQERFAEVSTPTLLLTGGDNPQWVADSTAALHAALPNSRVEVLPGQAHVAMNTAPELFVDVVLDFVRNEASTDGGTSSTPAANEAIVRRLDAIWDGDMAIVDELIADDFINHNPIVPDAPPGPAGFKQNVAAIRSAFPDIAFETIHRIAAGDKVALNAVGRGTHEGELMGIAPTGRQVTLPIIVIFRLANGQIVERWAQTDTLGLLRQLGALPEG